MIIEALWTSGSIIVALGALTMVAAGVGSVVAAGRGSRTLPEWTAWDWTLIGGIIWFLGMVAYEPTSWKEPRGWPDMIVLWSCAAAVIVGLLEKDLVGRRLRRRHA